MTTPLPLDRLRQFIKHLEQLHQQPLSDAARLAQAAPRLAELVRQDDWLAEEYAAPHPQHYQQYLLHMDAEQRFSIVSFVWGPGQITPIHDHRVWGLIGVLRGAEIDQRYVLDAQGTPQAAGDAERLTVGQVAKLSEQDGDIHQVRNAFSDRVSISIHVYGGNIGAVRRAVYSESGVVKPFVSGYSNTQPTHILGFSKDV
ncbi:cysteine dioxygenase [Serratia rubidaea]|uniref:cysteine dioxygenase family protein n=1 Tax=Serratia rubidaea TaxID=61652 RepID=UPI001BAF3300|nr:cysteine dioxygenase [Serratia rubidaea]MBS0974368.1 cysteine dioxygenase [Serratia rubidaea]